MKKKRITILLSLMALALSLLILVPLLIMIFGSFKDSASAQQFNLLPPKKWHFNNYIYVIKEGGIGLAFANSMLIMGCMVVIDLIFGSMCAFIISRRGDRASNILYYIFMLGMISPMQVITTFGLLKVLGLVGSYQGVILVELAIWLPWTIFTITGFIKGVPRDLDEAAFIDGAGTLWVFAKIILPLLKPIMATLVVSTAMASWNEFMIPLYFFNSPGKSTMPLTVYNFFGQYASDWNYVFSDLVLTALPITVLYLFCQKYIIAGQTAGAVKG